MQLAPRDAQPAHGLWMVVRHTCLRLQRSGAEPKRKDKMSHPEEPHTGKRGDSQPVETEPRDEPQLAAKERRTWLSKTLAPSRRGQGGQLLSSVHVSFGETAATQGPAMRRRSIKLEKHSDELTVVFVLCRRGACYLLDNLCATPSSGLAIRWLTACTAGERGGETEKQQRVDSTRERSDPRAPAAPV